MTYVKNCDVAQAPENLGSVLRSHPVLGDLPAKVRAQLSLGAQRLAYRDGTCLFREGDSAQHWWLVECGSVEVLRYGWEGSERVFGRFSAGRSVAEAAMFMDHGRYPMTARVSGATVVWRMDRSALRQSCLDLPELALHLLADFSRRLYDAVNEIEWLTSSSAPQRLAAYLVHLPAQAGRIELPDSQRLLAARLGIRAETLSRLLADWQARRWIRGERRHWALLDSAALSALASGHKRAF